MLARGRIAFSLQKIAPTLTDPGYHLMGLHGSARTRPHRKRHLDGLAVCCRAHGRVQQTDRPRYRACSHRPHLMLTQYRTVMLWCPLDHSCVSADELRQERRVSAWGKIGNEEWRNTRTTREQLEGLDPHNVSVGLAPQAHVHECHIIEWLRIFSSKNHHKVCNRHCVLKNLHRYGMR